MLLIAVCALVTLVLAVMLVRARRALREEWMRTPVDGTTVLVHEASRYQDPDTLALALEAVRIAREREGSPRT